MLQLVNTTPLSATLAVLNDLQGIESCFVYVKATYKADTPDLALLSKQPPLLPSDVYTGEDGKSSLAAAGEVVLPRPSTDVLISGFAYGHGRIESSVTIAVGEVTKRIAVFGDRVWKDGFTGPAVSPAQPFVRIPLDYEHAFGGTVLDGEQNVLAYEPRNPIGRGITAAGLLGIARSGMEGALLPNLELPDQLITHPSHRPAPAATGPVSPHWRPRIDYAGTYDDAWTKQRAPYLPADFDPRFLQTAPADQIPSQPLLGGEPVALDGVTSNNARWQFDLPRLALSGEFEFGGSTHVRPLQLDVVHLWAEQRLVSLVWSTAFPVDKDLPHLATVTVRHS